jgi:hypothetical protein
VIIGKLIWYDESPSWLAACVAGFGRVCDTIVAVDGAYQLYPRARSHSMPEQREAIMAAAEAAGCGCVVYQPRDVWAGNEVAKRNAALDLCRHLGTPGEDWVLVFDSDFQVMQVYADTVRAALAETEHHVATYTLLDGQDMLADEATAKLARHTDVSTQWTVRTRSIYRLLPGLQYHVKHWNVIADNPDGPGSITLFGPEQVEEEARLEGALVAYHRRKDRAKVRLDDAAAYFAARDLAGAEGGDLVATKASGQIAPS